MKILKVKVTRDRKLGVGTHYTHPFDLGYAPKINFVAYESVGELGVVEGRGDKDEYWIGIVKDEDASLFVPHADIEEITPDEADSLGKRWRPSKVIINDPDAVLDAVLTSSTKRTVKQKKALNPDDPEPGIYKTPAFDVRKHIQ